MKEKKRGHTGVEMKNLRGLMMKGNQIEEESKVEGGTRGELARLIE